jgi:hypothetical protein
MSYLPNGIVTSSSGEPTVTKTFEKQKEMTALCTLNRRSKLRTFKSTLATFGQKNRRAVVGSCPSAQTKLRSDITSFEDNVTVCLALFGALHMVACTP